MEVATRAADWLGGVVDLMAEPSATLPVTRLLAMLHQAFEVGSVGWTWFEPDGRFGVTMDPPDGLRSEQETFDLWLSGELFECHPLLQWFRVTGDLRPQTTGRVPARIVPRHRRLVLEEPLRRLELDQQLSIVYRQRGAQQRGFVLARGARDFSDDAVVLAAVVQRSLVSLDHQVGVMQRISGAATGAEMGLTGRELAVLQLVGEGASTRQVARDLACSPRTIEKHLERTYRKLGVGDRLNAVRVLRTAGVLGRRLTPDHEAVVAPGTFRGLAPQPART